jgi:threonine dehydrogenase-like Zn-dependent dehydrogenase
MLALTRHDSQLGMRQIDVPVRKSGEALVRVRMAGVCNTDLEIARGYMSFEGVLGHEFVGEVVDTDDAHWLGARVAGEINLACRKCETCARGLVRHCPNRSVLGILGKDGAFAEYLTLPIVNLHRVPDNVPDRAACFVEPIAACFEILEQVPLRGHERIAILGDGKLGQLIAMVLHERAAAPILIGKHEPKLQRARARGLRTASASELAHKSFDIVIEATGSPSGMQTALHLVRPRGTLVLKSTYHGALTLDAAPLVIDEITLVGSRCGPFVPAIASLAAHHVQPDSLIDAVFPLSEAHQALQRAAEPGVLKVLLQA